MQDKLTFLFLGDLVGKPGRTIFARSIDKLRAKYKPDAVIVNGENSADNGRGLTSREIEFFKEHSVDAVTTGNHVWFHKSVYASLSEDPAYVIRPANYPSTCPGIGYTFLNIKGHTVAILNLLGRVFMHDHLDCPFKTAESLLQIIQSKTKIIFVDFHAEATSEKQGLGFFLDGEVTGVYGTHTHVQTSDEKILPEGTSYISDLGFSGSVNSMLGMRKTEILRKFLTQMPSRFTVEEEGPAELNGICVKIDAKSGKSIKIERIKIKS